LRKGCFHAGFFVLPVPDARAALATLAAITVSGFIIDVGRGAAVGGERLIERLHESERWRRLPIVVTGARPAPYERLSRCGRIAEAIPARERGSDAVTAAVRRATNRSESAAPFDDVPGRHAWSRGQTAAAAAAAAAAADASTRTLRRWIAADEGRRRAN